MRGFDSPSGLPDTFDTQMYGQARCVSNVGTGAQYLRTVRGDENRRSYVFAKQKLRGVTRGTYRALAKLVLG